MERVSASQSISRFHHRLWPRVAGTFDDQIGSDQVQGRSTRVCVRSSGDTFRLHTDVATLVCVIAYISCLLGCQRFTSTDIVAHYPGINLYLGDDCYIDAYITPANLTANDAASLELRAGAENLGLISECDEKTISKAPGSRLIRGRPNSSEEVAYENDWANFYFHAGKLRKVHIASGSKWEIYDRRKKVSLSLPVKRSDFEKVLGKPDKWSYHRSSRP